MNSEKPEGFLRLIILSSSSFLLEEVSSRRLLQLQINDRPLQPAYHKRFLSVCCSLWKTKKKMFFRFVDLFLMKFNCVSYHNWIISRVRAEKKKEYAEAGPIERAKREARDEDPFGTRNNTTSKKTNSPSKIFRLANGFHSLVRFRFKNISIRWFIWSQFERF